MHSSVFYTVYFEGDGLVAFSDWFFGKQSINQTLYSSQSEAQSAAYNCNRACIVYNASNRSFLNDIPKRGYSPEAISQLIKWARKNIPLIVASDTLHRANSIYQTAAENIKEPALAPAALTEPAAALTEPAAALTEPAAALTEPAETDESSLAPAWAFYEHSTIHYEQLTLNLQVEIGNIADKVCSAIRAYGADFYALADLAKGITLNLGVSLTNETGMNEYIGQLADADNKNNMASYVLIKFEKKISATKIKVGGFFKSSKKASEFNVTFNLFKPKNKAAKLICDALINTKIQYRLNLLKDN